jgi:hypothetical protein
MDKQSRSKRWGLGATAAAVGLIAVCTPCCAPLIAAIVAGPLAALGLGAYFTSQLSWQGGTLIALVAGSVGIVFWRLRIRFRQCEPDSRACQCTSKCDT